MTLSLDDVRNKRFRMARKGGYEVLEVDEFVDQVEESFAQLTEENASLKKQVDALKSGSADQPPVPPSAKTESSAPRPRPSPPPSPRSPPRRRSPWPAPRPLPPSPSSSRRAPRPARPSSASCSCRPSRPSTWCARPPTRRAASARTRAAAPSRSPRTPAPGRSGSSRRPGSTPSASRPRPRPVRSRWSGARPASYALFGDLDRQRDSLTETVARLREFEQKYRSSLHDHLQGQLEHPGARRPRARGWPGAHRTAAAVEPGRGLPTPAPVRPTAVRGEGDQAGTTDETVPGRATGRLRLERHAAPRRAARRPALSTSRAPAAPRGGGRTRSRRSATGAAHRPRQVSAGQLSTSVR